MKASNPLSRIRAAVSPGRILCRTWDYSTLAVQKAFRKPEEAGLRIRKDLVYTDNPDWTRDCKLDLYQAPEAGDTPRPLLIHLHGTAFDGGGKRFCVPFAEQMAKNGISVLVVDYGLSPQYNFKESLQHLCEALHWVVSPRIRISDPGSASRCRRCTSSGPICRTGSMTSNSSSTPRCSDRLPSSASAM